MVYIGYLLQIKKEAVKMEEMTNERVVAEKPGRMYKDRLFRMIFN